MAISRISVRLDTDTKARLERSAKAQERSLSTIAQKAIISYLDAKELKQKAIAEALAKFAQETHLVSGEAVNAWVDSWDNEAELPVPGADITRRPERRTIRPRARANPKDRERRHKQ